MNKLLKFIARHIVITAFAILFSLVAIVGSAYGFTKIADITSVGVTIPEVKTAEVLSAESNAQDPKTEKANDDPKKSYIKSVLITPSQNTIINNNEVSQNVTPVSQKEDKSKDEVITSPSPIYEKDDDTENLNEDKKEGEHLEDKSENDDR